jgi:osmotically-inducible protein OsmY
MNRSVSRALHAGTILSALLACTSAGNADDLHPILVTARKNADAAADARVATAAEAALHADPFFYDAHVTAAMKNGVLTLHGIVFDDWDLRDALRIARKVAGVQRVVNDLEIKLGGE